jgi:hypothetical protein
MALERRFYQVVPPNTTVHDDYVIPDGITAELSSMGGNAGFSQSTSMKLIWDRLGVAPQTLMVTYGDSIQTVRALNFAGDGAKVLSIELKNDTSTELSMGGFWVADGF